MAILQYIPPKKKIHDNRNPEGGYYVASCENCNSTFYPKRSNAKFCTPNCGLISHRVAVANGTAQKRVISKPKKEKTSSKQLELTQIGNVFRGNKAIYQYLKANYNTRGDRELIMEMIRSLEIGDNIDYKGATIYRISTAKYEVV